MTHLDTNILIALTNADLKAKNWITSQIESHETLCVSSITWYEFLAGPVLPQQVLEIELILDLAPIPFDSHLAIESALLFNSTGRARKRKTDAMIATTALLNGGKLATRNTADFQAFTPLGLELIPV